jgi:hypothetical protein
MALAALASLASLAALGGSQRRCPIAPADRPFGTFAPRPF